MAKRKNAIQRILKIRNSGRKRVTGREKYEIHNACCKVEMLEQQLATQAELGTAMQASLAHGARSPSPSSTSPIGTIYSNAPTVSTPHQLQAYAPFSRSLTAACAQCADNARQDHYLGTTSWQRAAFGATRQLVWSTVSSAMQGNERTCAQCVDNAR